MWYIFSRLMTKLTKDYSAHASKCCNKTRTRLIVATINPILRRPCVHASSFHKVLIHNFCSPKHREIIIFEHNYFRKRNTKQASHCFDFYLCIFSLSLGLDTSNQLQSILTLIVQTIVSGV